MRPAGRGIKLHLGCGDYWFDGYINIDHGTYGGTDMKIDIKELPFQGKVVEIIEAYEVLEHFNRYEADDLLNEWKRVLIDGGKVRISVPNMDGLIEKYATNKEETIKMIYGYEDNPGHKQGYTQETLKLLFEEHGFKDVVISTDSLPERPNEPQLVLEAHL